MTLLPLTGPIARPFHRKKAFAIMREEVKRGWWDGSILDEFEAVAQGFEPAPSGRVR